MPTIAPYTSSLHAGNAYWMARISKEIYRKQSNDNQVPDEEKILANLKAEDDGFVSVSGVDKNTAQGAVIEHENYLCVAFRGTNELRDWLDNVDAFATKELFGEFHRGFWNSVADIWKPLDATCRHLQQQHKRPIFFTGHSLGGAMATVAASRYIHEDKPFTSVYTFGQPRVLGRSTARIFNAESRSRYFRFHNNNDIVTRVPARFMGYSHIGTYLYISEERKIHQESGFWFRFVDYFDGAFDAFMQEGIDGVEDHSMDKYLEAVAAWDLD